VSKSFTECTVVALSPLNIEIGDAFSTAAYTSTGTAFTISITGLSNPATLGATTSFSVYTTDASGYDIESVTSGVSVQMTSMS
jgi:hypothetical protein